MRNGLSLGACNAHIQALSRRLAPRLMRGVFGSSQAPDAILPRRGIDQILICRYQHRLGDSIALTPLLEELATVFPSAKVDIITAYPAAQALYGSFGNVRSTFLLPAHVPGHLLRTLRALHSMRRRHYDLAIDPDLRSQSSRLLTLNAHADRRLGFVSPHKSGTLSHGVAAAGAPSHRAMTAGYLVRTATGEDPMRRPYRHRAWGSVRANANRVDRHWRASSASKARAPRRGASACSRTVRAADRWMTTGGKGFSPPLSRKRPLVG